MAQKLISLSPYDHVECNLCGTNYDCSPKGMYRHERTINGLVKEQIVCAVCVQYKNKHLFTTVPIE